MAAFYLDNDVAQSLAALLHARGHAAVTARQLGLHQAADAVHLLTAAEQGWIFVTHNTKVYIMLHEASAALGPDGKLYVSSAGEAGIVAFAP